MTPQLRLVIMRKDYTWRIIMQGTREQCARHLWKCRDNITPAGETPMPGDIDLQYLNGQSASFLLQDPDAECDSEEAAHYDALERGYSQDRI